MRLFLKGHSFRYAAEQLLLSLFPEETVHFCEQPFSGDGLVSSLSRGAVWTTASAALSEKGVTHRAFRRVRTADADDRLLRRIIRQSIYEAVLPVLPAPPVWGALSGVRPSKLSTRCLLAGGSPEDADRFLRDTCYVAPERRRLCIDASLATVRAAGLLRPQDLSVYIGIPFCPTRCSYCSFVSISTERSGALLEPFLENLLQEISFTGDLLHSSGKKIRTLYIGGGTPTIFSAGQLARLMEAIGRNFDLSECLEFTVEGGRPDTLDPEKLRVLHEGGCSRISVNPQTMSDEVLRAVGRRHTAADVIRSFHEAQAAGFQEINMDLIAGLPGDAPEAFARSLETALALRPSNLTVHTLALKKGAALYQQDHSSLPDAAAVAGMVDLADRRLRESGYGPYYLYRQKYMSGSFENVGWCLPGSDCLYNIYMMEELHSILSLGGGGMSKICFPGGRLERLHNPKYPQEYLSAFPEVLAQKKEFFRRLAEAEAGGAQ